MIFFFWNETFQKNCIPCFHTFPGKFLYIFEKKILKYEKIILCLFYKFTELAFFFINLKWHNKRCWEYKCAKLKIKATLYLRYKIFPSKWNVLKCCNNVKFPKFSYKTILYSPLISKNWEIINKNKVVFWYFAWKWKFNLFYILNTEYSDIWKSP